MKKKVSVASVNAKSFVEAIIELASKGATITGETPVYKGMVLRTTLEVDEDVYVEESPIIRVLPTTKVERDSYVAQQASKRVIPAKKTKTAAKKSTKKAVAKEDPVKTVETQEKVEATSKVEDKVVDNIENQE